MREKESGLGRKHLRLKCDCRKGSPRLIRSPQIASPIGESLHLVRLGLLECLAMLRQWVCDLGANLA